MPSAAIFDLDRTLISGSSSTIVSKHLADAGISTGADLPFTDTLAEIYERFGENWLMMQPAKYAGRTAAGWNVEVVDAACAKAAKEVAANLQPFAASVIDGHRAAGRLLVLATTSPEPFVRPIMEALGFNDVVCTKWRSHLGRFTGELDGEFLWGRAKAHGVIAWAEANNVNLADSYAYSDSYFDTPLLDSVGHPVAVNPDLQLAATAVIKGWPIRHLDKSEGVAKIAGREIQDWTRPLVRPEIVAPYARFEFNGIENIPSEGPALLVFNHRSYFDPTVMGLVAAKAGRNIRGLGKKEVFDAPIIGKLASALGGIRVERASGSNEPLDKAALVGCGVTTGWGSATYAAEVKSGETVVIIGCGGVGMNAVQGAAMAGAAHVIAVDPVEFKREQAQVFGATHTAASMEEATALVMDLTWGAMADKAIITVGEGDGKLIAPAMAIIGKGGRVVHTSVAPINDTEVTMSLFDLTLMQKQLVGSIFGSANPRRDIPRLLRMYQNGTLKLDELVTNTYSLDDINVGYQAMRDGENIRGMVMY